MEWRVAAKEYNYTWEEFCALEGEQQSEIVATYRTDKQMEAVVSKAQSDEMKRNSRKGRR